MLVSLRHGSAWVLTACLVLAAPGCLERKPDSAPGEREAVVQKVIDGDTIELADGTRVRYIGIDTPEVHRREGEGWVLDPQPFAEEAWQFNRALVERRTVRLVFDREREDVYDRLLAYVYLKDGTFVNDELVARGLARVRVIPPNSRFADDLLKSEAEARRQGAGLWSSEGDG
ncbi:MAG: thermonuclease family protein [Candidatus Omnitrophica bacterium]|nr:thermonuclease family protein [Candidatus Omnitrophota bacterium]